MDLERVLRQSGETLTAELQKAGIMLLAFDFSTNKTGLIGVDAFGNVQVDASGSAVQTGLVRQVIPIAETTVPGGGSVDVDIDLRSLILDGIFTLALEVSELTSGTFLDDFTATIQSLVLDLKDSILITFDADLVTSNVIDVSINGTPLSQVPFNASSDTTLADIAAAILAHANVEAIAVTGTPTNTILVTAKPELDVEFDSIVVTLGGSQAGATFPRTADVEVWTVPANSAAITLGAALNIENLGDTAQWSLNQAAENSLPANNPLPGDGFRLNFANGAGGAGKIIGKVIIR